MRKWTNKVLNEFNIKLISIALIVAMLVSVLFVNATKIKTVSADNYEYINLDNTSCEEDIKKFYNNTIPEISSDFEFINLIEYGWTQNEEYRTLTHKLYVYIYTTFSFNNYSKQNKIEIGTSYDSANITESSNVTNYSKFDLQKISTYGYGNGNFYKFKITDKSKVLTNLYSELRRYDVSGIELMQGSETATEYAVSKTYIYTGYTLGLGYENVDTLKCKLKKLDTITLDVNHTFYRTESSSRGAGYQNQIDTVYFSVPKKYFDTYGKLQRIKAEWYEFLTKDIIVTDNVDLYNLILDNLTNENLPVDNVIASDITWRFNGAGMGSYVYTFYGPFLWGDAQRNADFKENVFWVLPTKDWCDISNYDPNTDYTTIGGTEVNAVLDYLYSYNKSFNSGTVEIKDKTISRDLLQSDIEEYRKVNNEIGIIQSGFNGKSYYDFDADVDLLTWKTWSDTEHNFFENISAWGFLNTLFNQIPKDTGMSDISPIYKVTAQDMLLTDELFSKKLVVNINDVPKIKQAYIDAHSVVSNGQFKQEEELILFRFALTDYYSHSLDWYKTDLTEDCAYNARESIFLDFDIIQLTFKNEEELRTIAVVSSPIDIVDDTTPPTQVNKMSWLDTLVKKVIKVLQWIGIVVAVIILLFLLPYIIGIIKLIFRAIRKVIKSIINLFKNRKKERNGKHKKTRKK